ncbi:MAG: hypothetical protein M3Z85_15280, partial [Acidobacteriota bacterium]|nr:hypothetical protein [Acidobacteriota bacterium]
LIALAVSHWQSPQIERFVAYLLVSIVASCCKISLPGMTSTVSLGFVPALVNIIELPFSEAILISALVPLVQCLWKTKHRPQFIQVAFSASALVISTAFAFFMARIAPDLWTGVNLPVTLAIATVGLYGMNTVLVASAIGLVERRPLSSLWQRCYFYSFPYYFVGAAAAALMILTARESGWAPSLLVFPVMGLVYVSYRLHVNQSALQA